MLKTFLKWKPLFYFITYLHLFKFYKIINLLFDVWNYLDHFRSEVTESFQDQSKHIINSHRIYVTSIYPHHFYTFPPPKLKNKKGTISFPFSLKVVSSYAFIVRPPKKKRENKDVGWKTIQICHHMFRYKSYAAFFRLHASGVLLNWIGNQCRKY